MQSIAKTKNKETIVKKVERVPIKHEGILVKSEIRPVLEITIAKMPKDMTLEKKERNKRAALLILVSFLKAKTFTRNLIITRNKTAKHAATDNIG